MFKWTQYRTWVLLFMGLVVHGTDGEKLIGANIANIANIFRPEGL